MSDAVKAPDSDELKKRQRELVDKLLAETPTPSRLRKTHARSTSPSMVISRRWPTSFAAGSIVITGGAAHCIWRERVTAPRAEPVLPTSCRSTESPLRVSSWCRARWTCRHWCLRPETICLTACSCRHSPASRSTTLERRSGKECKRRGQQKISHASLARSSRCPCSRSVVRERAVPCSLSRCKTWRRTAARWCCRARVTG